MSEQEPESDYTNVSVPDDDLPDDLQPGEDNPLAEPSDDEADRQDLGDPHDGRAWSATRDDGLTMPDAGRASDERRGLTPARLRPSGRTAVPSVGAVPPPDRYGSDVLATDWRAPKRGRAVEAAAELGAVVEEVTTDWCGEIVAVDRDLDTLTLEDRRGKRRTFPLGPGFLLEGRPVILSAPGPQGSRASRRVRRPGRSPSPAPGRGSPGPAGSSSRAATTPSSSRRSGATTCGSRASSSSTSAASTTWPSTCATSGPDPQRRVGVLVDHLVPGSKESRIAEEVAPLPRRPARAGRRPPVRRHLGRRSSPTGSGSQQLAGRPPLRWSGRRASASTSAGRTRDQADIARAWQHILGRVSSYADLEPALLGRVEELIDFVTAPWSRRLEGRTRAFTDPAA